MSTERTQKLRGEPTAPEQRLWGLLRSLKPLGFHFRRQVAIGKYYADFACHHARLIIEVDGLWHRASDSVASLPLEGRDRGWGWAANSESASVAHPHPAAATLPSRGRGADRSPGRFGSIVCLYHMQREPTDSADAAPSSPSPLRGGTARSAKGGGRAASTARTIKSRRAIQKGAGQRIFREPS